MELLGEKSTIKEVLDIKDTYIFFYFTASWCGPCKSVSPLIERLANENEREDLKYYKVDIDDDDNQELYNTCKITKVPSYAIVKNRKVLDVKSGGDINIPLKILSDNIINKI